IGVNRILHTQLKSQFPNAEYSELDGLKYSTSQVAYLSLYSTVAEPYRHVRTRIQFSLPDKVIQTILVTSPGVGEGKSTTASNLAVIMAQADRRTLLIDADLRRPQQRRIFDASENTTLFQLLTGPKSVKTDGMRTNIQNLYLIT